MGEVLRLADYQTIRLGDCQTPRLPVSPSPSLQVSPSPSLKVSQLTAQSLGILFCPVRPLLHRTGCPAEGRTHQPAATLHTRNTWLDSDKHSSATAHASGRRTLRDQLEPNLWLPMPYQINSTAFSHSAMICATVPIPTKWLSGSNKTRKPWCARLWKPLKRRSPPSVPARC